MDNIRNELGKLRNEVANILQMDYSKRGDFVPSILGRIDGILEAPKRNCDVGTAEEQEERYLKLKREHVNKLARCPAVGTSFFPDSLYWAQMPYETVKQTTKENNNGNNNNANVLARNA